MSTQPSSSGVDPSPEPPRTPEGAVSDGVGHASGGEPGVPSARSVPRRRPRRLVRAAVATAFAAIVVASFAGGAAADRIGMLGQSRTLAPSVSASATTADARQFAIVQQAWELLRTQYVGAKQVDTTKMAYAAINGMIDVIADPGHTSFVTPDGRRASQAALSGTFIGIGVELRSAASPPVIAGLVHGGPSEAAGIRPGDVITAIDGRPTAGRTSDEITSAIRGSVGTAVTLTVTRPGSPAPLTFRIVRAEFKVPPVDSTMIPGTRIGMIRVEQFSEGAGAQLQAQLRALLAQHPTGLVLDLRGDPGGYVSEAVNVASQFLTSGDVYLTRDASGRETRVAVKPGALAPRIPLVVLVDSGTASSAEIVAGALQDAGRATLVGTTTFGTGTVVAEYPLTDGSALRIGTIQWLTPKRQAVWRHGLSPDVTVELPSGLAPATPETLHGTTATGAVSLDPQLAKALALLPAPRA